MPIPKKSNARKMKDFRPVPLTSILCKCMETVVSDLLTTMVADELDALQFAYKANRGVEGACLTLLDTVSKHLDSPHPHTSMDFSSAFNTVDLHTLCSHLVALQVNLSLILWIKDWEDRPQHVVVNGFKSRNMILNTGLPQDCVLSPILFSIYINNITCNNDPLSAYHQQVDTLMSCIKESSLELNISKTKELYCAGKRAPDLTHPLLEPLKL